MREIPLGTKRESKYAGLVALIDDADFELASRFQWCAHKDGLTFYVITCIKYKMIMLHRLILGVTDPYVKVDHKDGNGLHNWRGNIHIVDNSFNGIQRAKVSRVGLQSSSKYKGVRFHFNRWEARFCLAGKRYHCGSFAAEKEAARAYNAKVIELLGLEKAAIGRCLNVIPFEESPTNQRKIVEDTEIVATCSHYPQPIPSYSLF
jgi:hypothetical protein